jgi:AAA domain, putative AbiEii toxin, Type IV TA system/AAA ATPase domain
MILKSAVVRKFRSIEDSGQVRFEPDVTCLVGKNESGKTAFLEALYRSNPLGRGAGFQELRDYPRRLRNRERAQIPATVPVTATFELQDGDIEAVWRQFGPGVLTSRELQVERTYANRHRLTVHQDKVAQARHLLVKAGLDPRLAGGADFDELLARLERELQRTHLTEVAEVMRELQGRDLAAELGVFLAGRLPKFLYFDAFSVMPGRASIPRLQSTPEARLTPGERTMLALLRLAGVEAEEFTSSGYEARRAALEAAANEISEEVFEYWSQNRQLAVELDVDFAGPAPRPGEDPPFIEVRIRNDRHRVTLNFGERSEGFVWFFSFLVAFSEFRDAGDVVLLLDEPGLGLHAAGQGDLLRYVHEQLARDHQVVYTTHSPFMVDAAHLHRTRTVEDTDDQGTKVRNDLDGAGWQTVRPLVGALGYQLLHPLSLGPDTLVVDGPTELLYLEVVSGFLHDTGHDYLDPRWVLAPAGGLDGLPVLAALLGAPLDQAVLIDVAGGDRLVRSLVQRGVLLPERVVSLAELLGEAEAGIEDLFGDAVYLRLLAAAGIGKPSLEEVMGPGRMVARVERALGHPVDRYRVARTLLARQTELLPGLPAELVERFGALFGAVNRLLR